MTKAPRRAYGHVPGIVRMSIGTYSEEVPKKISSAGATGRREPAHLVQEHHRGRRQRCGLYERSDVHVIFGLRSTGDMGCKRLIVIVVDQQDVV